MNPTNATIDINADLGEGCPNDAALLELVTSTSVSCGAHAGDEAAILATLAAAKARGVAVGAHPGYPDRENFGRREQVVSTADVERLIVGQFEDLARLADQLAVPLRFVKPHGALYNQAQREAEVARGVVAAVRRLGLPVLGQPGSVLERLAGESGACFIAEGFPDRRYDADGRLVPRSRPDAVLHDVDEIDAQVARLAGLGLATLCVHGDTPWAVTTAETVRAALERHAITPRFWGD
jgi:UPF0271 protein